LPAPGSDTELKIDETLDEDVRAEAEKIKRDVKKAVAENVLVTLDLKKVYPGRHGAKSKAAVKGLTFSVKAGECFGLLGVNGAGKTSTFRMLTGDQRVTSGEAWVNGFSILKNQQQLRQSISFCPQFDALNDLLTGRETLALYCRLHGIPEKEIPLICSWFIRRLNLDRWADRVAKSYSGGNKRKLSIALALLGKSAVVMLDEPTANLDFGSRKYLWNLIDGVVRAGRSVLLTSHSMDECQALCSRISIMVDGQFQCLGSPQHLKSRFGDGYNICAKIQGIPPNVQPACELIEKHFAGAKLKECHNGFFRYQIPTTCPVSLADAFDILEAEKESVNLEDYSISQVDLETIFCTFAEMSKHEDEEETSSPDGVHQPYVEITMGDQQSGSPQNPTTSKWSPTSSRATFEEEAYLNLDEGLDLKDEYIVVGETVKDEYLDVVGDSQESVV